MGEPPLVAQHRVLVRAERREHDVDEVSEAGGCLRTARGPGAIGFGTEGRHRQRVEHRAVDRVEAMAGWLGPGPTVARRRLAVFRVEVPAASGRFVAVQEVAEATTLRPVEILHDEALPGRSPAREVATIAEELIRGHHLDVEPTEENVAVPRPQSFAVRFTAARVSSATSEERGTTPDTVS